MRKTAHIMNMPVIIDVVDPQVTSVVFDEVFGYLHQVDEQFSTFKPNSEIEKINRGEITKNHYSSEMVKILHLCEQTKQETNGYFDIALNGKLDPSGLVKGYAIQRAAEILQKRGFNNIYVEIAGDIQTYGTNTHHNPWRIGIENPFTPGEIIKVVELSNHGIATSGDYVHKHHIHNPITGKPASEITSITVISPTIFDADRFATAAFAMGKHGLNFIESLPGFEAYMITNDKRAHLTTNFDHYELKEHDA